MGLGANELEGSEGSKGATRKKQVGLSASEQGKELCKCEKKPEGSEKEAHK